VIDCRELDQLPGDISASRKGESGRPSLTLFTVLLLSVCFCLSDVKLTEKLDDQDSVGRFCGFAKAGAHGLRSNS
jgi:hypothetical protein